MSKTKNYDPDGAASDTHDVIDVLSELFILRGLPAYIRSDYAP